MARIAVGLFHCWLKSCWKELETLAGISEDFVVRKTIISIDWDHTLRKMDGLDVNILILMFYAQANNISIGLTTHRDIENTTLYTLYHWQYQIPENNYAALAAAISYWNTAFFSRMNIKLNFINARYQPLFNDSNYYEKTLLPIENALAKEIINDKILENPRTVRSKISEHINRKKEAPISSNQYKEKQILWLYEQYNRMSEGSITIVHLDDDKDTCHWLPIKISEHYEPDSRFKLKTIYCNNEFLLLDEGYCSLLNEIGLFEYAETLIRKKQISEFTQLPDQLSCLSGCLLLAQMHYDDIKILSSIRKFLVQLEVILQPDLLQCYLFAKEFIATVLSNKRPICLLANDLKHFLCLPG